MSIKGMYTGKPVFTQLMILILLALIGTIAANVLGVIILLSATKIAGNDMASQPDILRLIQFLSAIGIFIFPAFGMAWLCSRDIRQYLSLGKIPGIRVWLLLLAAYFLLSPVMTLTQYVNQQMTLPDFLAPVEKWMREQEDKMEYFTRLLTATGNLKDLLMNIIVIAIMAGVSEELFFRGALQRVFERWTRNPHLVIWITAFLFSAIHLQFYGFIPRLLIGAYLGYLLYWSRNIWIPVIAHILNNLVAVLGMSHDEIRDMEFFSGDLTPEYLLPLSIVTAISLFILYPFFRFLKKKLQKELLSPLEKDLEKEKVKTIPE